MVNACGAVPVPFIVAIVVTMTGPLVAPIGTVADINRPPMLLNMIAATP